MRSVMGKSAAAWRRSLCSFALIFALLVGDAFVLLDWGLVRAPAAYAAGGDHSVFREATGGEVVTSSGFDVTWDTTVSASPNIALAGNESDISLSDGGKYLVLYNLWTEEGATGGGNRRSVLSYLTLDGTPLEYGYGSGYIRDEDDDFSAYNTGAAIIDAAAGQNLRVVATRDDTNPAGGTAIKPDSNAVSILKLDDALPYLRVHKSTRSADISGNNTFTDVVFDTADEVNTGSFDFTSPTSDVTLKGGTDQFFLVTANVKLNVDAGTGPRQNFEMRLTLDGTEIPGTRSTTYLRYDNGVQNGTLQYVGIIKKTASSDQTFSIEVRNEGTQIASTDIVADETALAMVALPGNAQVLSLSHNANQALTTTPSDMLWNTEIATAPTYFSHSAVSNPEDITIEQDGDYLFFASTYVSRNTGTSRDVPRLDWSIGGVTQTYGGHGSFSRGDQGGEPTYTSGASGGALFPSLTASQVVNLLQSDQTASAPNSEFIADQVALQAVNISTLIPDAEVEVSVLGDQIATTTPGATGVFLGETYVITENDSTRNVTNIAFTESGTVDAQTDIENVRLLYDLDTTAPYDCVSESYDGSEAQFGSQSSFNGSDGTVSFSSSQNISTSQSMCAYLVYDVAETAANGLSIAVTINDPSSDVVVTGGGEARPNGAVGNGGSTVIENPEITQAHYHWRNDDGSETGATSATGGVENTPALGFSTSTPKRLRIAIHAEGAGGQDTAFRLEYGEKVTSCDAIESWVDVGQAGGAWNMADSVNLAEGDDTTNIAIASGGVSDGAGTFVTPNGGVRDAGSQTGVISIAAVDFTELEYSIQATNEASEGVGYCFRVVNSVSPAPFYSGYESRIPLTVRSSEIDSSLTDFPVYVDLADLGSTFWNGVQTDGDDIRVTTADGQTELPYELVSIDTGGETGELHFKAPNLTNSANTTFYIYFDNPSASGYAATDTFGRNNVWTNGYEAVYHFPTTIDSTGNGYTLSASNITNSATTKVGTQAADFNGSNSIYTFSNASTILGGHSAVTFSGWIDSDVTATDKGFLATNVIDGSDAPFCMRYDAAGFSGGGSSVIKGCIGTTGGASAYETVSNIQTTDWQHVVQTWQAGQALDVYVDGLASGFTAAPPSQTGTVDIGGTGPLYIGAGAKDSAAGGWDGRLDEMRFASVFRSADWIAAEYSNQNTPSSFYSVGSADLLAGAGGQIRYSQYPEATLSADVRVSATGTLAATVASDSVGNYSGGVFVVTDNSGSRNVTNVTITELGTVDATQLTNVELYYELDTTAPYNCVDERYDGTETQFGSSIGAFSAANGTSTFTDSVTINTTSTLCLYPVFSVSDLVQNGETIELAIQNPPFDVLVSSGSVGPGTTQAITGSTTISAPILEQSGYH